MDQWWHQLVNFGTGPAWTQEMTLSQGSGSLGCAVCEDRFAWCDVGAYSKLYGMFGFCPHSGMSS